MKVKKKKIASKDFKNTVMNRVFQKELPNDILSDLDMRVPGMSVDRWCGSSMEAIHIAAGKIAMGSGKIFICGGVESMTRVRTGFDSLPYPYSDEEKENPHL